MAKREKADDLFNEIIKGKPGTSAPAETPAAPIDADMVPIAVRISPADRDRIIRHFEGVGLRLSTGLRLWILERARQEGLK